MKNEELTDIGQQVAKRGRPKGSGGSYVGDARKYIRHALSTMQLAPIDIADIEQVKKRVDWYLGACLKEGITPTVSGLCCSLGIDRKTLYRWEQGIYRENTHQALIVKYKRLLEELWETQMVEGQIHPIAGIFLGKNHFGYADKQDIIVTPNNPLGEARDPEEVRQRYLDSVVVDELPPDDGEKNG